MARLELILTGDMNLLRVTDSGVPFARVKDCLQSADVVFANPVGEGGKMANAILIRGLRKLVSR